MAFSENLKFIVDLFQGGRIFKCTLPWILQYCGSADKIGRIDLKAHPSTNKSATLWDSIHYSLVKKTSFTTYQTILKVFCFVTGYSFLVIPLLVFLVLITNKLDAPKSDQWISYYFTACAPLFLTFFTLIMAAFGSRGGELTTFIYTVRAPL